MSFRRNRELNVFPLLVPSPPFVWLVVALIGLNVEGGGGRV